MYNLKVYVCIILITKKVSVIFLLILFTYSNQLYSTKLLFYHHNTLLLISTLSAN